MADYTHLYHLKINKVSDGEFAGNDGNLIENVRGYWPDSGVPYPSVGWVFRLDSDASDIVNLLIDVGDEENEDVGLDELKEFVKKETGRQRGLALTRNPVDRKKLARDNLKTVLDFLRLEPYTTVDVMALVLEKSVPGTRRILNKMVDQGWLIRDEVDWIGSSVKKHLFGVSTQGLYHLMDDDAVEPPPSRDFKRGQATSGTAGHILNIQLARLYFQRCENEGAIETARRYKAARDLPYFQTKIKSEYVYKWWTYPDAVIEGSHVVNDYQMPITIAIEIEQHYKSSKRYKEIIKQHWGNIDKKDDASGLSDRYDRVVYFLGDSDLRDNLKRIFHRLIDKLYIAEEAAKVKKAIVFDTYNDLPGRIQTLG